MVTTELISNFQHQINQLTLIMGSNGIFEVKLDDELIFSKKELNRYPETGEIAALLKAQML